jgi:hypothetical protein
LPALDAVTRKSNTDRESFIRAAIEKELARKDTAPWLFMELESAVSQADALLHIMVDAITTWERDGSAPAESTVRGLIGLTAFVCRALHVSAQAMKVATARTNGGGR